MIPAIANQTEVLILQHPRERKHPFNTARIAARALSSSCLVVAHPDHPPKILLHERAGLLFPGVGAQSLDAKPRSEQPTQLVVVDGTWHHAKTMVRDIPDLANLPRYEIPATAGGRYSIRREPHTRPGMSTLEAIVAALRSLESETTGLDELLLTVERLVARQLTHPKKRNAWRRKTQRTDKHSSCRHDFAGNWERLIVAYGEHSPADSSTIGRQPIYWLAQRLHSAECFAATIECPSTLTSDFLSNMDLHPSNFDGALSLDEFRSRWSSFVCKDDILVVYNKGTLKLIERHTANIDSRWVLKSIIADIDRRSYESATEVLSVKEIDPDQPRHPGRGGVRLEEAIAIAGFLRCKNVE